MNHTSLRRGILECRLALARSQGTGVIEQTISDGQRLMGTVSSKGDRFEAVTADGAKLGTFETVAAARSEVIKADRRRREAAGS